MFSWIRLRTAFVVALIGLTAATVAHPAVAAAQAESQVDLSDDEIGRLFDAALPALSTRTSTPSITGSSATDERITRVALARGYRYRGSPIDKLGRYQGWRLQQAAITDLIAMQEAMAGEAGVTLTLTSAYRSVARQRSLFLGRLRGSSRQAINETLKIAAPPGFSRHHTGYAIDVSSQGFAGPAFRDSAAWDWLTANTYENAMRFGWIPSYPDGASAMGPNPEPWEWVWIGRHPAACARSSTCAVGGLDKVRQRTGRVAGWASMRSGSEPQALRLVTAKRNRRLMPTPVTRFDLQFVFGATAPPGFTAKTTIAAKAKWACLEARAESGAPWSRVGCVDLR
jgi:D-alanyl-D-alanine carboxypeptidase